MTARRYLSVDIVLPCYNPAPNWVDVLISRYDELRRICPEKKFRLIVVNDGSVTNFTPEQILVLTDALPDTIIAGYEQNCGKGSAVRCGMAQSTADMVIYTDIDMPYSIECMNKVIQKLVEGYDVVIGMRDVTYYRQLSRSRKLISHASKFFNPVLLNLRYKDTQGGLKGLSRKGIEVMLDTKVNQFLFDTEFVMLASKRDDVRIVELGVHLREGIHLPNMGWRVLWRENRNLIRLMQKRWL